MTNRKTLEAMLTALRVHPTELTGQPWAPPDAVGTEAHAWLMVPTDPARDECDTDLLGELRFVSAPQRRNQR